MARNGTGSHSVPNTFSAGSTITASEHNENWSDISAEITNSVAADGQTTMTGQFKAANGTLAAPSISFGSDLNTGRYRKSADTMADVCAGAEVVEYSSTGISAPGSVNAAVIKQGTYRLVPAGTVVDYAGSSAPDGWLLCYGQAVSRTTYADLYTALGTTYGTGDGSTTFNVPDCRGRVVAGKDDMGGSSANRLTNQSGGLNGDTLGATGGAETHTLDLTEAPAHDHGGSTGSSDVNAQNGVTDAGALNNTQRWSANVSGTEGAHTHTISSAGGGAAHNNVQPTIILNKIIKY